MERTKLLFICSQNKWRSLTAEKILQKDPRFDVRSAGTDSGARVRLTAGHLGWADKIFVMESKHSQIIKNKFAEAITNKKLICLRIPDKYEFMDERLIALLKERLKSHLDL